MPNFAETGRAAALSAMMVGVNGADLAPKYDAPGLPAGAIELKVDMPRINIDSPVVVFDQTAQAASPLPSTEPIANPDNCLPDNVPVTAVDGAVLPDTSPLPEVSPQPTAQDLNGEQTAVAPEDCEQISTYENLVNLLTSEENPDPEEPGVDFTELSKEVVEFYDADEFQLDLTKRGYGVPKKLLANSKKELEIEEIDSRNPEVVSKPLEAMLATFSNTENEAMLEYIQDYILLTRDQMPEEYTNHMLSVIRDWKSFFDKIDAKKANNSAEDSSKNPFDKIIGGKVNKKATIPKIITVINNLYEDKDYKELLGKLHSIGDENSLIKKKDIIDPLENCLNNGSSKSDKEIWCLSIVEVFVNYAGQFPADSENENEAKLNAIFIKAAQDVRSATINFGVSAKSADRQLKIDAENYASN